MAIKTQTKVFITDDISGVKGATTLKFSIDDMSYEIDLGKSNRAKFDRFMAKFIENARTTPPHSSGAMGKDAGPVRSEVRQWALENGFQVAQRGRLSIEVMEAFLASANSPAEPVDSAVAA